MPLYLWYLRTTCSRMLPFNRSMEFRSTFLAALRVLTYAAVTRLANSSTWRILSTNKWVTYHRFLDENKIRTYNGSAVYRATCIPGNWRMKRVKWIARWFYGRSRQLLMPTPLAIWNCGLIQSGVLLCSLPQIAECQLTRVKGDGHAIKCYICRLWNEIDDEKCMRNIIKN